MKDDVLLLQVSSQIDCNMFRKHVEQRLKIPSARFKLSSIDATVFSVQQAFNSVWSAEKIISNHLLDSVFIVFVTLCKKNSNFWILWEVFWGPVYRYGWGSLIYWFEGPIKQKML